MNVETGPLTQGLYGVAQETMFEAPTLNPKPYTLNRKPFKRESEFGISSLFEILRAAKCLSNTFLPQDFTAEVSTFQL